MRSPSSSRFEYRVFEYPIGRTDMGGPISLEHDPTSACYGWSTHVEMESMVKAGLTPSEVITAATRDSAQSFGLDRLGTVASGKSTDFLVLDANPLGGQVDRGAENIVEWQVGNRDASADDPLISSSTRRQIRVLARSRSRTRRLDSSRRWQCVRTASHARGYRF